MPFSNLNTRWRLGIANSLVTNASRWAKEVIRLPSDTFNRNFPVYQQQLVRRSTLWEGGPSSAAAETCSGSQSDSEVGFSNVIREISVHDTVFARRNISAASTANPSFCLNAHSGGWYGQTYYLNNEPEFFSASPTPQNGCNATGLPTTTNACCAGSCWDPRDTVVDTTVFPSSALASFWESRQSGPDAQLCGPATPNFSMRCQPESLAFVYLRLKRIYEGLVDGYGVNRGHSVLVPSAAGALLGADDPISNPGYWTKFFDKVIKFGMSYSGAGNSEMGIGTGSANIQKLKTLHFHYYSPPRGQPELTDMPLETVAEGAYNIRRGVDWFRTTYNNGSALPLDILLSESGFLWNIERTPTTGIPSPKHKWWWGGGWNNFKSALSWWNTWLWWLMRQAPIDCQLSGSTSGTYTDSHALYANIHNPWNPPYVTQEINEVETKDSSGNPLTFFWRITNGARNQWHFNSDAWAGGVVYGAEVIDVTQMLDAAHVTGTSAADNALRTYLGRFQRSFSTFPATPWDNSTSWRIGPIGACYKVWAEVGADAVTENLTTGWVTNFNAGLIAETQVNLPQGYSTVYFPIIKAQIGQTYAPGTQFSIGWRNGAQICNFGCGDLSEFPDSNTVSQIYDVPIKDAQGNTIGVSPRTISPTQSLNSAMVYPVVCFASSARQVTVRLTRNFSGPRLAFGRPIVLPQACSWFITQ